MIPHDLLPIKRPLEDDTDIQPLQFYENVVQHLIPDIVRMEANGIPIDLKKVQELEKVLDNTLADVQRRLSENPIIQQFMFGINNKRCEYKKQQLETKIKTFKDFIIPFKSKNKIHRTYVVNQYLIEAAKTNIHMLSYMLADWKLDDLKKLNKIIASKFIDDLLNDRISDYMQPIINAAMEKLAQDKADAYNKNNVQDKIDNIKNTVKVSEFNPASSLQKQQLFEFCGIESEKETVGGNPQFDRKELERLQKLIGSMINE